MLKKIKAALISEQPLSFFPFLLDAYDQVMGIRCYIKVI